MPRALFTFTFPFTFTGAQLIECRAAHAACALYANVYNGARSSGDLAQRGRELGATAAAIAAAAERSCSRPTPPAAQFGQLHREATQVGGGSLGASGH